MKLNCEMVIDEIAAQMVAIPIKDESKFSGLFMKINSTGAYILNLLKEDITVDKIVSSIEKDFYVENIDDVTASVLSFIENLKKVDVLDYEG